MKRLATALVGAPLVLWATFRMAPVLFFWSIAVVFCLAAWEYARIQEKWAGRGPLWLTVVLVPATGWLVVSAGSGGVPGPWGAPALLAVLAGVAVALGVLLARTPVEEGAPAMGAIAFGALYLGLPLAALADLQSRAPWLLFLLFALVWLGDSAAYYVGTRFGRRRLAPIVSPNKSWVGSLAAVVTAMLAALAFGAWREGRVDGFLVVLALLTSIAAQLGDLVESLIKRGAGVKDSGAILPGHGGFLDRIDALLVAAPFWWLALEWGARLPPRP
jgi:phosphatidate cytidylyltransferase